MKENLLPSSSPSRRIPLDSVLTLCRSKGVPNFVPDLELEKLVKSCILSTMGVGCKAIQCHGFVLFHNSIWLFYFWKHPRCAVVVLPRISVYFSLYETLHHCCWFCWLLSQVRLCISQFSTYDKLLDNMSHCFVLTQIQSTMGSMVKSTNFALY